MPESVWYDGPTLRRWHLKNFKSVKDATVDLAPLTVVVGANSAGKSTLLQSIRIAAQAASNRQRVLSLERRADSARGPLRKSVTPESASTTPSSLAVAFHLGTSDYYSSTMPYLPGVKPTAPQNPARPRRRRQHPPRLVTNPPRHTEGSGRIHPCSWETSSPPYVDDEEQARFNATRATQPAQPSLTYGHEIQYEGTVTEHGQTTAQVHRRQHLRRLPPRLPRGGPRGAELLFTTWFEYRTDEVRGSLHRRRRVAGYDVPRSPSFGKESQRLRYRGYCCPHRRKTS